MTIHSLLTRHDTRSNWVVTWVSPSLDAIAEAESDLDFSDMETMVIHGEDWSEIKLELNYWNEIAARDTALQAAIDHLVSVHGDLAVCDAIGDIDDRDLDTYHDRVEQALEFAFGAE